MQDKIAQPQADANKLSKAAGINPNTVNNMIKQNMSAQPNPQLRQRFTKKAVGSM